MDSYFDLVHELYQCGARNFLLLNVPPVTRAPKMLLFPAWHREIHRKVVREFNQQLEDRATELQNQYLDVCSPSSLSPWRNLTDLDIYTILRCMVVYDGYPGPSRKTRIREQLLHWRRMCLVGWIPSALGLSSPPCFGHSDTTQ